MGQKNYVYSMFVEVVGLREILGKVGTVLRATVSLSLNTLFLLTMEIVKTLVLSIVRSIANIKRVFFYQIFQLLETRRQRVVELYLSSSKNLYGIILYFMNECYYRNFNGTFCLSQFPGLCFHLWQKKEKKKNKRNGRPKLSLQWLQLVRVLQKFRSIWSSQFANSKWTNWRIRRPNACFIFALAVSPFSTTNPA